MSRGGPALVLALALSGCGLRSADRAPAGPAEAPAARIVPRAPLERFPAYAGARQFTVEAVRGKGDYNQRGVGYRMASPGESDHRAGVARNARAGGACDTGV